MRWMTPSAFWLLIPWLALPVLWYVLEKQAREKLEAFASSRLLPQLLKNQNAGRRRTKFLLGMAALFFAILALARPQVGIREETVQSEGLDLVFLLDVSNSMRAEDVVPSRLVKAKHIMKNFIDRLSGDRAGVVVFAGSAYPAVPLTTDYEFILQSLDVLDESAVSNQGSDLAKALGTGVQLLARGSAASEDGTDASTSAVSSRVMVILSDGESHEKAIDEMADKLKQSGIRVFSIGVGSLKGGPIPIRDENGQLRGYKRDLGGSMVHTKLEPSMMESLASQADGKFYIASANEGEVEEIMNRVSSMDRTAGGARVITVYDEIFQYPLFVAVMFFLLMLFIREGNEGRRRRTTAGAAAGLAAALLYLFSTPTASFASASLEEYRDTKRGKQAYEANDYAEASRHFGSAQAENPDSPVHHFNLGNALMKSGSPEAAIKEFERALGSDKVNGNDAGRTAYNLGKAYEVQGNREKAIEAYQQGLDRLSADAKADPEVELRIKRALEQAANKQQKQSDQSQQNQQQQGKGDQQDQQKKEAEEQQKRQQQKEDRATQGKKREFKAEKLTESDARRILEQLKEQEKKTQQRMLREKTGKPKNDKNEKDW